MFILLFLVLSVSATFRPVIGVMSQPVLDDPTSQEFSFIPASYVKWLESGGARIVPILFDLDETRLKDAYSHINGLVFTGGAQSLAFSTKYMQALKLFYDWSLADYDHPSTREVFPIWGTCMGFQALVILTSQNDTILGTGFDSYNLSLPLDFTAEAPSSRLFSFLPNDFYNVLDNEPVTINQHHDGIEPDRFRATARLNDFYHILSTNEDRIGRSFVSAMESSKGYPIWGVQYHPEKISFEAKPQAIVRTPNSIVANLYHSLFLVDQARRSTHRYATSTLEHLDSIWNTAPVYTLKLGGYSEQLYYFPEQVSIKSNSQLGSEVVVITGAVVFIIIVFAVCGIVWVDRCRRKKRLDKGDKKKSGRHYDNLDHDDEADGLDDVDVRAVRMVDGGDDDDQV